MRLLVVDDNDMLLAGLRRVLPATRRHWQVTFAASSAEALAHLESHPVDAVFADLYMPHVGGGALLDIVRQRWPHALRVLASGDFDRLPALDLLAVAHQAVEKPYLATELTSLLEDALRVPRTPVHHAGDGNSGGNDGDLDVARLAAIAGMARPGTEGPAPRDAGAAHACTNPWRCLLAMQAVASPLVTAARRALDLPQALTALGPEFFMGRDHAHGGAPASLPVCEREHQRVTGIGGRSAIASALAGDIALTLPAQDGSTGQASVVAQASALFAAVALPALPDDAPIDLVLVRSARELAMRGVDGSLVDTILAARAVSHTADDVAMSVRLAVDLAHGPRAGTIAPVLHRWLHDAGIAGSLPRWQAQGQCDRAQETVA